MESHDAQRTDGPGQGWAAPDSGAPDLEGPTLTAPVDPALGGDRGVRDRGVRPVPQMRQGPMTVSDILDGSFRILKARPRTVLGTAAVFVVPIQVVTAFATRRGFSDMRTMMFSPDAVVSRTSSATVSDLDLLLVLLASLASTAVLFFVGAALTHLVTGWYTGVDRSTRELLSAAFRRTLPLLAAWVVLLPVKAISAAACYLGLIVTIPLFSLTAPAMAAEGLGPIAGAKRSWTLGAKKFWRTIGIVLLVTFTNSILSQILSSLPTFAAGLLPSPIGWIVAAVIGSLSAMVTTSVLVGASVLMYVDLRMRTEGLDIELELEDAFGVSG